LISSLRERIRFHNYRAELNFLQRQVTELESRKLEAQFHLKTNRNKLISLSQHRQFIEAEDRYFEKHVETLELAIEQLYIQLRELKRKIHY